MRYICGLESRAEEVENSVGLAMGGIERRSVNFNVHVI